MPPLPTQKEKAQDDSRPFGVLWLDSCYQETLLPGGPWQKVSQKLCDELAEKVQKQKEFPDRMQMIFHLLGYDFVQKYFANHDYDQARLEPPNMSPETRKKLQLDAQKWLQSVLEKAAAELGCQRPVLANKDSDPLCEEMEEFLQHSRVRFSRGMDRHLYLQEREVEKQWEEVQLRKQQAREAQVEANHAQRLRCNPLRGRQGPKGILKNSFLPLSRLSSTSSGTNWSERPVTNTDESPPVFWGMQSNSLGRSVIAILKRDPRRFSQVAIALHGRQLPSQLRAYIWLDVLLKQERSRLPDIDVEKIVRERFGKGVARGVGELGITRATHCPVTGLIDTAVIETYGVTPAMQVHMEDTYLRQAAKALNILYVYDRTYEPYLVHWLFPLQLAFEDSAGEREHVYELAMFLDLLNKTCFPKWPQIFATAERVMSRLQSVDSTFEAHLKIISQKDPRTNPKEFLVHMIHQEKAKAEALLKALPGSPSQEKMSKELLADPLVFLRKWMGEGFVGVLDTQAAVYVWDQCFLKIWDLKVIEDFCLALLLLLRHSFLRATDYMSMKTVFLNEPCKLYTADIQKAWVHLQGGGDPTEVPNFNRQTPESVGKGPRAGPSLEMAYSEPSTGPSDDALSPAKSPAPSQMSLQPLQPAGIKNIRLKLCVPAESIDTEKWLSQLKVPNLKLLCTMYFGTVKLRSHPSVMTPVAAGVETDSYGTVTYWIEFPGEKFVFHNLDLSEYDVEKEMGGYPVAIIRIDYSHQDRGTSKISAPVTLGWSRVKIYQHSSELQQAAPPSDQQWLLLSGDSSYPVHAGPMSHHSAGFEPKSPSSYDHGLLGANSQLDVLIYDPANEPPDHPSLPRLPAEAAAVPPPALPAPAPPPSSPSNNPRVEDTFDLYVDGVDNIPDSATVVKVTGRLCNTGRLEGLPDILAYPELNSSARCPRFKYRLVVNDKKVPMATDMVLLLRVYTVEKQTGMLVVVGSCLFDIFDSQLGSVRVGGHSRVLHHGMPSLQQGGVKVSLTGSLLDGHQRIPAAMVHFRLDKHSQDYQAPAKVGDGFHRLQDAPFSDSEKQVAESFERDATFPKTVTDMIVALQAAESNSNSGKSPLPWLQDRLNNEIHLAANTPARNLDLASVVRYRPERGLKVQITRAYGFPEGLYMQCFARVAPGQSTAGAGDPMQDRDSDEKLISLKHDYSSLQKAPQWRDEAKTLHPKHDVYTCLVVQIFGLDIMYTPQPDHSEPGTVKLKNGQEVALQDDMLLGWAVLPLFKGDCVLQGEHHIPVFKGKPDDDLLDLLTADDSVNVLQTEQWTKANKYDAAALAVKVFDAHFVEDHHLPVPLTKVDFLLEVLGQAQKANYTRAEIDTSGRKLSDFVVQSLDSRDRKYGTNSDVYRKEQEFYEKVMSSTFYRLMEDALMTAGYGPL